MFFATPAARRQVVTDLYACINFITWMTPLVWS